MDLELFYYYFNPINLSPHSINQHADVAFKKMTSLEVKVQRALTD